MPNRGWQSKLHWDPASKEVRFPLDISGHTVICRVPRYVLKRGGNDVDVEPLKTASEQFDLLLDIAVSKVSRHLFERDGSVLVRLMDLPDPPESPKLH